MSAKNPTGAADNLLRIERTPKPGGGKQKVFYVQECLQCGCEFTRKVKRKFCSRSCFHLHCVTPPKEKICAVCGEVFFTKERQATCSTRCGNAWRKKNNDYSEKRNRKISETSAWMPGTGRGALGVGKKKRTICLTSPSGEKFITTCVRQFVRDHESLFDKRDLARRQSGGKARTTMEGNMTCNAMSGLQYISSGGKKRLKSWKGWTAEIIREKGCNDDK